MTMAKSSSKPDAKACRRSRSQKIIASESSVVSPEGNYEASESSSRSHAGYQDQVSTSASERYNHLLLSYVTRSFVDNSPEDILAQLKEWKRTIETHGTDEGLSLRRKKRKDLILAYNNALLVYASGNPRDAAAPLLDLLRPFLLGKSIPHEEIINAASRIAYLMLDCILALAEGHHNGLEQLDDTVTSGAIVRWLESLDFEADPQLKFLLTMYKSRLDFAARNDSGKMVDSKGRNAKKELKSAMEVLNHRLRPALTGSASVGGETASVGSLSDIYPYENNDLTPTPAATTVQHTSNAGNHNQGMMEGHNQSVLNLKAHLEQRKGNMKKSLVLCAEARLAHQDPSYEAIHSNNMALVYATGRKIHLALHSSTSALTAPKCNLFRSDGTVQRDPTLSVLHNSAMYALQGGKYTSAYECMAACVQRSLAHFQRPRCWLRMSEACIGIHAEQKGDSVYQNDFLTVEDRGVTRGVLLETVAPNHSFPPEELAAPLGSQGDLEQVSKRPLQRALYCLAQVFKLCAEKTDDMNDMDCLSAARCAFAYVKMEMGDYRGALNMALSMLLEDEKEYWEQTSGLRLRMHKQRIAAARLYGCEACHALGNTTASFQLLSGKNDIAFLQQLAVDLAGGSVGKEGGRHVTAQVSRAKAMVQTNASAIIATVGDIGLAKELALSSLQISESDETTFPISNTGPARRALLYCMLRDGNQEGALAVLRSAR